MNSYFITTYPQKALAVAEAYENKSALRSSLNIYQSLLKCSEVSLRVKINTGNVYFKLNNYRFAIKYYKMALDQVGQNEKETYSMIMHNIGLALVQQKLYSEAMYCFAYIIKESPDLKAYIHQILCAYAIRNPIRVRRYFRAMFSLQKIDQIDQIERIVFFIAPFLEADEEDGFNWCLDIIRITSYAWMADNLEVSRIMQFMRNENLLQPALRRLEKFELNVKNLTENSKINLSYVYLHLNKPAKIETLLQDCSSAKAYNNVGVYKFNQMDYNAAKYAFQAAWNANKNFYESIYNLALVERRLGNTDHAQKLFNELLERFPIPTNSMVNYQVLRTTQDRRSTFHNLQSNLELFGLSYVTDPKTLKTIGDLYKTLSNFDMAKWYFQEAYAVNPLL